MLQQTQVERVIPKYLEFLQRFPTLEALAEATPAEVIRAWSPLGYNQRAVRVQAIARQVTEDSHGRLPHEAASLARLKGLGPYTAAAVACFAFGVQGPVVDTNVRRVLGRILLGQTRPAPKAVAQAAREALPQGRASEWNQALMDIGATLCAINDPRCLLCPARPWCRWAAGEGETDHQGKAQTLAETRAPYWVQPPFKGSSRYYRGRIVDYLRSASAGGVPQAEVGAVIKEGFTQEDIPWLEALLSGLERDGLVRREGERVRLP
ncbi:MAG: A/G-specific adenine glycosylase [Chloroflexi bacterium]|nr:A/G-specific adenine glycosylase [Chloroflexota bacterium]